MLILRALVRFYFHLTNAFICALRRQRQKKIKGIWISSIPDNNIFHVWYDALLYYSPYYREVHINEEGIDKESSVQKWRLFVLKKLYPNIKIIYTQSVSEKKNPTLWMGFDLTKFIKYSSKNQYSKIVKNICSKQKGEYVLCNQRAFDDRYLFDSNTSLPLEEFLKTQQLKFPIKFCAFHEMTVEEQYEACSRALVFVSAHGAGCTNLIFTPIECPLIEINQRTHWYCDPVCDDHFFNKTSINDQCQDKLNFIKVYHKSDFHNLSYLIGKKYREISPVKYDGVFKSRNPISKQKIFIDGNFLVNTIEDCLNVI